MSRTAKLYWAGVALFAIGAGSLLFAATRGTGEQPEDGAARVTAPSFPATLRPPRTTTGTNSPSPTGTSSTTTSAPESTPATTRLVVGPCNVKHEGSGPLQQFYPGASTQGGALGGAQDYIQAGGKPEPAGWQAPSQQGFDWTGNGAAKGKLAIDRAAGTVTVEWGTGRLTVTGIRATIDIAGEHADTTPAAVADVTGDGRFDLIVVKDDTVAVIAGQGAQTRTRSIAFEDIGKSPTEWVSPPRMIPINRFGDLDQFPRGKLGGTIVPLWDINGDGVKDFSLDFPRLGRGGGGSLYYAGQPCQAT